MILKFKKAPQVLINSVVIFRLKKLCVCGQVAGLGHVTTGAHGGQKRHQIP